MFMSSLVQRIAIVCALGWWAVRQAIDASRPAAVPPRNGAWHGREPGGRHGERAGDVPERLLAVAVVVVPFIYTGAELSAGQWAASYLREQLHAQPAYTGLAVAGYWGAYALVRLLMAVPGNQPRARVVMPAGCTVALAGALVIALAPTPVGAVTGLVVVGAGLAPVFPAMIGLTPVRLGQARAPQVIGWQLAAAGAGGLAIAALTGVLLGQIGLAAFGPILVSLIVALLAANWLTDLVAARRESGPARPSRASCRHGS